MPLNRHGASRHATDVPAIHHRVVSSNLRYCAAFQGAFWTIHDTSSWTRRVETTAVESEESGNGKKLSHEESRTGRNTKDRTIREPSQQRQLMKANRERSRRRDQRAIAWL